MRGPCAICSNQKRGTNRTTVICRFCAAKPENKDWRAAPTDEFGVTDVDMVLRSEPLPIEGGPGKYETAAAIEVMKLYCLDVGSVTIIAEMAGVSKSWAYEVIQHWSENYGQTVSELRAFFTDRIAVGSE